MYVCVCVLMSLMGATVAVQINALDPNHVPHCNQQSSTNQFTNDNYIVDDDGDWYARAMVSKQFREQCRQKQSKSLTGTSASDNTSVVFKVLSQIDRQLDSGIAEFATRSPRKENNQWSSFVSF